MRRKGGDKLFESVQTCLSDVHTSRKLRETRYTRGLAHDLREYDVLDCCKPSRQGNMSAPWKVQKIDVEIVPLNVKKIHHEPGQLRCMYGSMISRLPRGNSLHVYCDGSVVEDGRAGCGVLIREYTEFGTVDRKIELRLSNYISSTQAELQAILACLEEVRHDDKNVFVFVDSRGALESLNSRNPVFMSIVEDCKRRIAEIQLKGHSVKFMWIPSHVGIVLNEVADDLAKRATSKPQIDIECEFTMRQIRSKIRNIQAQAGVERRGIMYERSLTMQHYMYASQNTLFTYGKRRNAWSDSVYMRLGLGYKYYWEYGIGVHDNDTKCKLCGMLRSHTLAHYVLDCPLINVYRNTEIRTVPEQIAWMCHKGKVDDILERYKNFAPRL
ncbi:uncharacterized protein [Procambarus clarkii]|uniref:uncharacterized protein n=1 Tax=Procambarus clarkii TaxID=6728 RepID=UPI003743B93F